ncbi:hypothetical protein NDA11_003584 [Ustilago hordei]|uniref:Uncharacterized protein n=1 Tax=Ustilago hordei TaxID=120017 RepID=I2G647_USTHO|nr:uncharacterized protein UHO2_02026 [Ustilago hordei]KAJ1039083.1 hypothetical protein NDA10_003411 [Ustilago hordei]KAJ1586285.1 hypothetical protein NDA12_006605 [Ustilago hordei]KAJ1589086.1 hypothetical protein NDA15_002194 [Ustilago hordei]KAJ1590872.1 hypothetical protein NDA11_003584 [Ustilago hordei]KAJ1600806.1 hypothetical protein NDA14_003881 [Ustilago hordei]
MVIPTDDWHAPSAFEGSKRPAAPITKRRTRWRQVQERSAQLASKNVSQPLDAAQQRAGQYSQVRIDIQLIKTEKQFHLLACLMPPRSARSRRVAEVGYSDSKKGWVNVALGTEKGHLSVVRIAFKIVLSS